MYKDGYLWSFFYCGELTSTTGNDDWKELKISSLKLGKTVTFATHIRSNYVEIICNGVTLKGPINSSAYNRMIKGSLFRREMVIAVNPNKNARFTVPTGASFSSTKFSNTDMYKPNGSTEKLSTSNSSCLGYKFDSGMPKHTYYGDYNSTSSNGYVNDVATGSI